MDQIHRVQVSYPQKVRKLRGELKAGSASAAVQGAVSQAIFATNLAYVTFGQLCQRVADLRAGMLTGFQEQEEAIETLERLTAEMKMRLGDSEGLSETIVKQQEAAIASLSSTVPPAYGLRIAVWQLLVDAMAEALADLYEAADRNAIVMIMKRLLGAMAAMTPLGAFLGTFNDVKDIWELSDDRAAARGLARGVAAYEEYATAAVQWAILVARATEACDAGPATSTEDIQERASARIERTARNLSGSAGGSSR